ncbi:MAG: hypothetical protein ABI666_05395 [Ferruginibacter sp.]
MKIEQLLVQHFYNAKEVTLQGMGTFTMSPDFVMPSENDKDLQIPDNAISFQYNSRSTEDDALINYIVQQTRKMKALASADLDSYLVLGKQFLNIGKPFKIEGLGLLLKNQQGEYEFTQGHSFNAKSEAAPAAVREKHEDEDISFASESKSAPNGKKWLLIAAIIIGLGMTGAAAWYFFMRDTKPAEKIVSAEPVKPDTNKIVTPAIPDSSLIKKDSVITIAQTPVTPASDGYTFKVVFRILTKSGAIKKMGELNKSYVIMYTTDSVHYKLAEKYTLPLSDTTRIKDSLRVFYDFKTFIELK